MGSVLHHLLTAVVIHAYIKATAIITLEIIREGRIRVDFQCPEVIMDVGALKKSFFQIVQIFVTGYAYMHVRGGVNGMKDDINIGRNTMNEKEG